MATNFWDTITDLGSSAYDYVTDVNFGDSDEQGTGLLEDIGSAFTNKDGSISLHARSLQIDHPVTKEAMSFKANPEKMGIWKSVLSC